RFDGVVGYHFCLTFGTCLRVVHRRSSVRTWVESLLPFAPLKLSQPRAHFNRLMTSPGPPCTTCSADLHSRMRDTK
ncbi:unnamed protein product, partial [Mycena citricolor]